ncbi:glucoamylase family protein [Christiangramia sediminicola]|uniref:Glucoamylase family protein n=1 Tax=Christiangramia sediminicola TaxID=3073267 RepID=A0ABU1ENJ1_9FLAO|nr:glucoamylase family protein [Christiangramia sp. SM2212]MDR5589539.1 glucoamylase family protein [Christiangramia sp. SM2212]
MFRNYLAISLLTGLIFTSCKNTENRKEELAMNAETTQQQLSDEALMDTVQEQTLKYFWDYAEPNSGMARERFHPDGNYPKDDAHVVTTGGSGFGLMGIVVGMERGFIPRDSAVARLNKIADFLDAAPRFHGAWSHWLNGETGDVQAFGEKDNGGDIVETSFLAQGFIVVREYLKNGSEKEKEVANKYDELWQGIEWNWYTNNKDGVYWHWSPVYEWEMDFMIEGYNECLITYVMAASSPDHAIDAKAYHDGWARSGKITTDVEAYGLPLILKHNTRGDMGGPLFWAHYSYLGLNPKGLSDKYANYWGLNVNHSLIDYKYCQENPKGFETYNQASWGLTASYTRNEDGSIGYTAHSPDNDRGVVSPTAAISSIPYTPEESLAAMRYFYSDLNGLVWGPAGFYDAFSLEGEEWAAQRYLAIDQGPMVVMIENYRSGLIWDLFMGAPEVQIGLKNLGFEYEK